MISIIVARARNGAIGRGNDIPWRAPEDLAFFKRETLGGAVIMGRRTWDSLPFKPLKDRLNLVVSTTMEGPDVFPTPEDAIRAAGDRGYRRIYAIGGAAIYSAFLPMADRLLVTEVDIDVPDADTFFPPLDPDDWVRIGSTPLRAADPPCTAVEYLRRGVWKSGGGH
ncbi:dihydrofolate reductase [Cereibacter sp. SYSU M97828]|nr:dihydrofolate reductase [Cereibacter flavus]